MKPSPRPSKRVSIATPLIVALLLAIAALPGAALAAPPPTPPDDQNNQQQAPPPPPGGGGAQPTPTPPPPPPDDNTQQAPPPPPDDNQQQAPPPPPSSNGGQQQTPTANAHPDAPDFPSADCIVTHAATPAQLCPVAGGLQYYFIGADGSSQTGPYIKPFSELAVLHTAGTVSLYTGSNPFTGKSVTIDYLVSDDKLRISTYYPDTQYDTDKPYTFTVDTGNAVTHEAW